MNLSEYDLYVSDIKSMFELEAMKYENLEAEVQETSKAKPTSTAQYFDNAIYGDQFIHRDQSIGRELTQYLSELPEPRGTDVLVYWKSRQEVYPALAKMAMTFLAIPATSAPSEGVFSKTKNILGPQRASLSSLNVEVLLCLKDWYRLFGPLFVVDREKEA